MPSVYAEDPVLRWLPLFSCSLPSVCGHFMPGLALAEASAFGPHITSGCRCRSLPGLFLAVRVGLRLIFFPSVCLPVCLSACLLVCLSACLLVCLSVCLSVCVTVCPSVSVAVSGLSVSVCLCPSLPACLFVSPLSSSLCVRLSSSRVESSRKTSAAEFVAVVIVQMSNKQATCITARIRE